MYVYIMYVYVNISNRYINTLHITYIHTYIDTHNILYQFPFGNKLLISNIPSLFRKKKSLKLL